LPGCFAARGDDDFVVALADDDPVVLVTLADIVAPKKAAYRNRNETYKAK
jgi:hypothetical protein